MLKREKKEREKREPRKREDNREKENEGERRERMVGCVPCVCVATGAGDIIAGFLVIYQFAVQISDATE